MNVPTIISILSLFQKKMIPTLIIFIFLLLAVFHTQPQSPNPTINQRAEMNISEPFNDSLICKCH
jgi:hypothetical protein